MSVRVAIGGEMATLELSALADVNTPLLTLSAEGVVADANNAAEALLAQLDQAQLTDLDRLVKEVVRGDPDISSDIMMELADGEHRFRAICLPLAAAGDPDQKRGVLVLLTDITLEHNLRAALVDSRQRYKDFVEISSDFAWETNSTGEFVFVSPRGALGFSADHLVGCNPRDLAIEGMDPENLPFFARQTVEDVELWLTRKDGGEACVIAAAMPILDVSGQWMGARGVCRDVTGERQRDAALSRARNRERLLTHVVRAFRDVVEPDSMLNVAAEKVAGGIGVDVCQIFRAATEETISHPTEVQHGFVLGGHWGEVDMTIAEPTLKSLAEGADKLEISSHGYQILAAPTRYRHQLNGALVFWREARRGPWNDDDRILLTDLANQIGIANEQISHHQFMVRISRTDALTGLFNRRAFNEELERRHQRLAHDDRPGALLYVDLDNFKPVNDLRGHQKGDEVLMKLREILLGQTRPTDLVARLGGDEFAIWLEGADVDVAVNKAKSFLKIAGEEMKPLSAGPDLPLGMSLGIALHQPGSGETLEQLLHRADETMYAAKHGGKGTYRVSAGPDDLPDLRQAAAQLAAAEHESR